MFLKANKDNGIIAEVIGGRKHENGLVVPCLYKCRSKNKKIAEILIKEVSNSSEKYQHMDIIYLKGVVPRILSIIKNTKFLFYNLNLV